MRSRFAALTLALALPLSASACSKAEEQGAAPARPPLDAEAAANALRAVEAGPPEAQATLAARALFELESARLPAGLLEALDAMVAAPPDMRTRAIAKGISASGTMKVADHLCRGEARAVLSELAELAQEERNKLLWTRCDLEAAGLVTQAELAKLDPTLTLLAHLIFDALQQGGGLEGPERALLEHMLRPEAAPAPGE